MNLKSMDNISKFLSFVLRHKPETIGLELDEHGWVDVDELIKKAQSECELTFELLERVVEESDKKRFAFSADMQNIRANQGHSVKVDLQLEAKKPPRMLYHGTATRFVDSIMQEGLKAGSRHHVHLSVDVATATAVGKRYGKPCILEVAAGEMFEKEFEFFVSENGVWLTEKVPVKFIHVE
ncbi:RNA 2'-phosphotransferase [Planctomycetota bacterium]|nr:RNA 2'-phosphotransferase [Planctomycetota bacterium]